MKSYMALKAEIDRLQAEAEKARQSEKKDVVARIRSAIDVYGLTAADLGIAGGSRAKSVAARAPASKKAATSAPKYRDPKSGKTWTGRGKPPLWIAGKERSAFEIGSSVTGAAEGRAPKVKNGSGRRKGGSLKVGVAKYRDGATGKTWTGRGKPPNWILGKNRDDYLIR